jgi:hypothetical protein
MKENKSRKKVVKEALLLVSVLAFAIIGLWLLSVYVNEAQKVERTDSPIRVSLRIIKEEAWTIEYLDVDTYNNTVYTLLLECSKKNNFSVDYTLWRGYDSVFVNAINGTDNGENGMWWQYYVDDVYGEVGCDRKEIFDGDVVEWRFEEPGQ